MAYTAPVTHATGDLITASDWNVYIRDNWLSLTDLLAHSTSGAALSGWTELVAGRGRFIVGLVSGGVNASTVGTALTDQQNVTHTHTVPVTGWTGAGAEEAGRIIVGSANPPPANTSHSSAAPATGTAAAGTSGTPYIQYMTIEKD